MKEEYTVYSCDICGKRSQAIFTRKVPIPAWRTGSVSLSELRNKSICAMIA